MRHVIKPSVLLLCVIMVAGYILRPVYSSSVNPKHVLLLHSYNQGYPWTDSVHEGFVKTISQMPGAVVHVEYLDASNECAQGCQDQLAALLVGKYGKEPLDLIAVSDDPALEFLQKHPELLPEVPVVFCGINNTVPDGISSQRPMVGVYETISVQETLDAAVESMTESKVIAVVSGTGATERKNKALFIDQVGDSYNGIPVQYLGGLTPEELSTRLSRLTEKDIVIYLGFMGMPTGHSLTVEESVKLVCGSTKAPVFGYWDFILPFGVVGGKVVHGQSQGQAMGDLANRVLSGEPFSSIKMVDISPNHFMFNEESLTLHGINKSNLPDGSYLWGSGTLNIKDYWDNKMAKSLFGYEMFETHGDMMWIVDASTGQILDANRSAENFYQYTELIGMNVGEINDLPEEEYQNWLKAAQTGKKNQFLFTHRTGDGRVVHVQVSSYPIEVAGRRVLFSIMRDVTVEMAVAEKVKFQNRLIVIGLSFAFVLQSLLVFHLYRANREKKAAQVEEARQRANFEAMAENNYDLLSILDQNGQFLYESRAVERVLGYPPEHYIGHTIWEYIHPEDVPLIEEKFQSLLAEPCGRTDAECRMMNRSGCWVWLESTGINLMDDPNIKGILVSTRDVTERHEKEDQLGAALTTAEAANAAKSRFLANMSHEIRTPMNGILGMLQLLELTAMDDEQKEYMQITKSSADVLLGVVNDILDYTKLEADQVKLVKEPFELRDQLDEAVALVIPAAYDKRLNVECLVSVDVPNIIIGDKFRLKQVLSNLLGNAVKFSKKGVIRLGVAVESEDMTACTLRFSVEDQGIGIPREKLNSIFQRFSQVDDTTTREFGGSGLGLAICRDLVALMGGEISAESTEDCGSTFSFTASFDLCNNPVVEVPESKAENFDNLGQRALSILIVEDDSGSRLVLETFLRKKGYQVRVAENGQQAVMLFENTLFDVIFMDCQMPVMDGFEATRQIRGMGVRGSTVSIVALTALVISGDAERCYEAGMNSYLPKPVCFNDLNKLLDTLN